MPKGLYVQVGKPVFFLNSGKWTLALYLGVTCVKMCRQLGKGHYVKKGAKQEEKTNTDNLPFVCL